MPWIDDDRYLNQEEKENNASIVIQTYHNLGLNDFTIASLLANMDAESTLSPCLTERGSANPGYGLVQWTPKSDLINACSTLGLSPYTSGDVQLQVIIKEILGQPSSINQWDSRQVQIERYVNSGATQDMVGLTPQQFLYNPMNWSAQKLAIAFMVCYLRPSYDPSVNHWDYRMQRASFWYNFIQGSPLPADYIAVNAPFIWKVFTVTSTFWEQRPSSIHKGLDITTGANDTVYSMCNGEVKLVANDPNGYGNYLIIKENITGLGFLFAHLDSISVSQGDSVYKGQPVGVEGTTGHSTGIHLHFEMQPLAMRDWIFGGDREDYINPAEYMEIPNTAGITAVYYGTSPTPGGLTPSTKFKWVLYSRKFRARQNKNFMI